jgi:ribosomal-protein-alanine N-acetyltransferase
MNEQQTTRIRPMTTADVPAVDELERNLFPFDAWPEQMFHDELAQTHTRYYLVAEEPQGTIVAYGGLMVIEPVADIQTIAVAPQWQGRGIGAELLRRLIAEAQSRSAEHVLLEVRSDNPTAQRLYRRFGFEQIHLRPRYYRDGADALVMKLRLGASQ